MSEHFKIEGYKCVCVGLGVLVCPFDWAHMCSPAVAGLQEHLKIPFNPACLHTHTQHTTYCRQRAGAALSLQYIVCVRECL